MPLINVEPIIQNSPVSGSSNIWGVSQEECSINNETSSMLKTTNMHTWKWDRDHRVNQIIANSDVYLKK